jgi:hypothetical protein
MFDLVVAIVLLSVGMLIAANLDPNVNPTDRLLVGLVIGIVCYLSVSSVLYRRLHRQPLHLPRCPICRRRDRHYRTLSLAWPEEKVECANCRTTIELELDRATQPAIGSSGPRFRLLWPYSFGGRWERIS